MSALYYGTEAILLASRDWGEADRLLTFFTKDLGRIEAVAKGVRLAKSKLKGHLTLFSRMRIMVTPGRELWRLLDAEQTGEENQKPTAHTADFAKFFMGMVPERECNIELWETLASFPVLLTPKELLLTKILVLQRMGMLPAPEHLTQFFSSRLVMFLESGGDDTFFDDPTEHARTRRGIGVILSQNHMV